jgi:type VI secretion system ImpA family protein
MRALEMEFQFAVEKLLVPISPSEPAGVSLRYDPVYDQLRKLRKADDELPQGVWKSEPKRADWKALEQLCVEILQTRSKDLQVAAWLLEAWIHLYGFAGAAEGMVVIRALCENFWEELHPRIEGGDVEFRIAPLVWINEKLVVDLKLSPITAPESENFPAHTWADWESACLNEKSASSNEARAVTIAKFQQGAMLTSPQHLQAILQAARRLFVVSEQLDALLDLKLRRDAPGLSPIKTLAGSVSSLLSNLLEQRGPAPDGASSRDGSVTDGKHSPARNGDDGRPFFNGLGFSNIRSRAQAYQVLSEAADFLVRTEPHSPVPYLVRRAVAWGAMSLETLMTDLIRNSNDLSEISRLLSFGETQKPKAR